MINKRKHPFYDRWYKLKSRNLLCEEWKDFEKFVRDIPSNTYKMFRKTEELPYSIDNVIFFDDRGEEPTERRRRIQAEYRKANPKKFKNYVLKSYYGITLEEYQAKLESQGNVCAICGQPEQVKRDGQVKALAVDHDHETGKVRGILCQACNKALGLLKDDVSLFQKSIDYLLQHKE